MHASKNKLSYFIGIRKQSRRKLVLDIQKKHRLYLVLQSKNRSASSAQNNLFKNLTHNRCFVERSFIHMTEHEIFPRHAHELENKNTAARKQKQDESQKSLRLKLWAIFEVTFLLKRNRFIWGFLNFISSYLARNSYWPLPHSQPQSIIKLLCSILYCVPLSIRMDFLFSRHCWNLLHHSDLSPNQFIFFLPSLENVKENHNLTLPRHLILRQHLRKF